MKQNYEWRLPQEGNDTFKRTVLLLLILVMIYRMGNRLTVLEQQMIQFKHDAASTIPDSEIRIIPSDIHDSSLHGSNLHDSNLHDSNLHASNTPTSDATCAKDGSCQGNNIKRLEKLLNTSFGHRKRWF